MAEAARAPADRLRRSICEKPGVELDWDMDVCRLGAAARRLWPWAGSAGDRFEAEGGGESLVSLACGLSWGGGEGCDWDVPRGLPRPRKEPRIDWRAGGDSLPIVRGSIDVSRVELLVVVVEGEMEGP